jgi:hypothetical protein
MNKTLEIYFFFFENSFSQIEEDKNLFPEPIT